jgi:hypothetical protein
MKQAILLTLLTCLHAHSQPGQDELSVRTMQEALAYPPELAADGILRVLESGHLSAKVHNDWLRIAGDLANQAPERMRLRRVGGPARSEIGFLQTAFSHDIDRVSLRMRVIELLSKADLDEAIEQFLETRLSVSDEFQCGSGKTLDAARYYAAANRILQALAGNSRREPLRALLAQKVSVETDNAGKLMSLLQSLNSWPALQREFPPETLAGVIHAMKASHLYLLQEELPRLLRVLQARERRVQLEGGSLRIVLTALRDKLKESLSAGVCAPYPAFRAFGVAEEKQNQDHIGRVAMWNRFVQDKIEAKELMLEEKEFASAKQLDKSSVADLYQHPEAERLSLSQSMLSKSSRVEGNSPRWSIELRKHVAEVREWKPTGLDGVPFAMAQTNLLFDLFRIASSEPLASTNRDAIRAYLEAARSKQVVQESDRSFLCHQIFEILETGSGTILFRERRALWIGFAIRLANYARADSTLSDSLAPRFQASGNAAFRAIWNRQQSVHPARDASASSRMFR